MVVIDDCCISGGGSDLPEGDDTLLRAPVGVDVEHARPIAAADAVVHGGVFPDVSVHGLDHPHDRAGIQRLRGSELIHTWVPEAHDHTTTKMHIVIDMGRTPHPQMSTCKSLFRKHHLTLCDGSF